jgi:hypothetical protein
MVKRGERKESKEGEAGCLGVIGVKTGEGWETGTRVIVCGLKCRILL